MIKRNQFFLVLGKIKNLVEALDVRYKEIKIKQHIHVNYLLWVLHETMSGETIVYKITEIVTSRLIFLYRKNRFLKVPFRALLFAFIKPLAWHPNWLKKQKCKLQHFMKSVQIQSYFWSVISRIRAEYRPEITPYLDTFHAVQVTQNKWTRFCLKLNCKEHISRERFKKRNCLTINQRFKQCVSSTAFIYVHNKYPAYTIEIFRAAKSVSINARNTSLKLNHPFWKPSIGQNGLSYVGLAILSRIQDT